MRAVAPGAGGCWCWCRHALDVELTPAVRAELAAREDAEWRATHAPRAATYLANAQELGLAATPSSPAAHAVAQALPGRGHGLPALGAELSAAAAQQQQQQQQQQQVWSVAALSASAAAPLLMRSRL